MEPLPDIILRLFDRLSDPAKLILLALLIAVLVVLSIWKFWDWRRFRRFRKQLVRKEAELARVLQDRELLRKRLQSLENVEGHLWTRADSGFNRYVDLHKRDTRFLAFCNLKGGVGKTTLAVNVGVCLALRGKRVLLIDLDFQGTMSNLVIDAELLIDYRSKGWTTDVLLDPCGSSDVLGMHSFPVASVPNCRAMIAHETLDTVEFQQQARFYVNPSHDVRFACQRLLHCKYVFDTYDYVLMDCPPRLSTACINALACADYVLVPTGLSQLDIEAVPRTLNWLKELRSVVRAEFLGAIVSSCRVRSGDLVKFDRAQLGHLKEIIAKRQLGSDHVFSAKVPERPEILHATAQRRPVVLNGTQSRGWFEPICEELERRIRR